MKTLRQILLREGLHKSVIVSHFGKQKQVDIYKNPGKSELNKSAYDSGVGNKETGVWLHGDDMYTFHRYSALHNSVKEHLSFGNTDPVSVHLYHHGKEAIAQLTDANRDTKWHHNPEVKHYVENHPQLKRHFSKIDTHYYDEDIHGPWHEMDRK